MVEHLIRLNPNQQIIILDNGSTYKPLFKWYGWIKENKNVEVKYLGNEGHLALWGIGLDKIIGEYFVYTDSDIILNENTPLDFLEIMYNMHRKHCINKIGLGLRIDDLPDHYRYKNQVIRNEGRWWLSINEVEENTFRCDTDTTFAFYKNIFNNQFDSLRLVRRDLIVKHKPWYDDLNNLDEEERYYLEHLGDRQLTQYSKQAKNPELYNDI